MTSGGWIGVISEELRALGLDDAAADEFACEYVVQQPYPAEAGTSLLSKRLRDYGLDEKTAEDGAATLLAVSLFTTRRNLGDVRRLLSHSGMEHGTALGAAMDASRIRREIHESTEERRAALELAWARLAPALVFTGLTALLFVMAGTMG